MIASSPSVKPIPMRRIIGTWWPLAASWLLMAAELPAVSAIMARLANPEINLAAYGGIVMPLALIMESPIIMLLAASTTLSKDWASYQKIRRFMMTAGAILTAAHVLVIFTPLYYVVTQSIIGAPAEIIEPARLGFMLMLPWTWSIAYRRFHQGVLIRFGHSRVVGLGTGVRLSAVGIGLLIGYTLNNLPGIAVAAASVAAGVFSEALFIGWRVQPVLRNQLRNAPSVEQTLTLRSFMAFYIPLVMTALISLLIEPVGSAALSRMPGALPSLAVWPVVSGLVFMLQSAGIALNEVIVTFLDEPHALHNLRRFTLLIVIGTTTVLLAVAVTPLASLWFSRVSALSPELAELARNGLWLALPMPAFSALHSWFQGAILHSRKTRGITESVVIYTITVGIILITGILMHVALGIYVGMLAFAVGLLLENLWLYYRSRAAFRAIKQRDALPPVIPITQPVIATVTD